MERMKRVVMVMPLSEYRVFARLIKENRLPTGKRMPKSRFLRNLIKDKAKYLIDNVVNG